MRLKTIDRHIYKLKYTSIYFGRALSDGTSFSSLNTEFDRILPEHIVLRNTCKTSSTLDYLIEWKRQGKLGIGLENWTRSKKTGRDLGRLIRGGWLNRKAL